MLSEVAEDFLPDKRNFCTHNEKTTIFDLGNFYAVENMQYRIWRKKGLGRDDVVFGEVEPDIQNFCSHRCHSSGGRACTPKALNTKPQLCLL